MSLVKKTEVNLEKESDRVDRRENTISVSENSTTRPSGKNKGEGVNLLCMLATKEDLR